MTAPITSEITSASSSAPCTSSGSSQQGRSQAAAEHGHVGRSTPPPLPPSAQSLPRSTTTDLVDRSVRRELTGDAATRTSVTIRSEKA